MNEDGKLAELFLKNYTHSKMVHDALKITNQELVSKARRAAIDYRRIYGEYPLAIGIEVNRIEQMGLIDAIRFPKLKEPAYKFNLANPSSPNLEIVRIPFLSVAGKNVWPNEVYLPHPRDHLKIISGAVVSRLLRIIGDKRLRIIESRRFHSLLP